MTLTWRFYGLPSTEAAALDRRVRERAAPETLSIVYTSESSLT